MYSQTNKHTMSKKINKTELLNLLNDVKSSTFIHLVTETKVRMNKTGNPYFDKVKKLSSCNYLIGNEYESRVHKNYTKEDLNTETFKVEQNKIGDHVSKVVLFNEKLNTYYLQVERFDETKPKVSYTMEGNDIDKSLFDTFVIKPKVSEKQEQDRYVSFISFKFESIKEITLNGTKYEYENV